MQKSKLQLQWLLRTAAATEMSQYSLNQTTKPMNENHQAQAANSFHTSQQNPKYIQTAIK
jgi:hypothetical protein